MRASHGINILAVIVLAGTISCDVSNDARIERRDLHLLKALRASSGSQTVKCAHPRTFYVDEDGDGYGGPRTVRACTLREGLSEKGGDCDDHDRRVHPGQTEYFAVPRKDGSFDFDCDGKEKRRLTTRAFCRLSDDGKGCTNSSGWAIPPTKPIPKCGEPEEWEWTECRKQVIEDSTVIGDGTEIPMAGEVKPKVIEKYSCWSGKLRWKKRQLCR